MLDDNAFVAHTPPKDDPMRWQTMQAHTENVAALAVKFAEPFKAEELARWAAWLHDVGKYSPAFQKYLRDCHRAEVTGGIPPKAGSAEHKAAGTQAALNTLPRGIQDIVALCVLGHHGGLNAATDTRSKIAEAAAKQNLEEAFILAKRDFALLSTPSVSLQDIPALQLLPQEKMTHLLAFEMLVRFVFSCLVDADSLDTEAHFNPDKSGLRRMPVLAEVAEEWLEQLKRSQAELQSNSLHSPVNEVRREVYDACLMAAKESPGVFSLTVPTGGGKTRSSLAFALAHAVSHQHSAQHKRTRIIYAIPYTSIIDQTAYVFRKILGEDSVLEHHSAIEPRLSTRDEDAVQEQVEAAQEQQRRLAAENWNAPLIVTTTVQLFESLFSNRTSHCRKLHHIAGSVLILDEVQTLPPHLLSPLVSGLRALVEQFGVTVVLCTATQPAVEGNTPYLRGLPEAKKIIDDPEPHFETLKRVTYHVAPDIWNWSRLAKAMRDRKSSCLAILNTKNDALATLKELKNVQDARVYHLSTLLCGAHRRNVLAAVREALEQERNQKGLPVLLVSTQVVEAGVDLDFPFVYRAKGPLDRIIQAAVNRRAIMTQIWG